METKVNYNQSDMSKKRTVQTAYIGLLLCLSLMLSYVETMIPLPIGVPGIKLGLANLAVVLCMYLLDGKKAFVLDLGKVLLSGFLFGNLSMIMYGLAGAIISFLVMIGLKKTEKFSVLGVSLAGGVFHNIGQLLVALVVLQTMPLLYYFAVLLISGCITGALIGLAAKWIYPAVNRYLIQL